MEHASPTREIATIDAWLKASGMSKSRLGLLACANARAVDRVRAGSGSVNTLIALLGYIKRNPVLK